MVVVVVGAAVVVVVGAGVVVVVVVGAAVVVVGAAVVVGATVVVVGAAVVVVGGRRGGRRSRRSWSTTWSGGPATVAVVPALAGRAAAGVGDLADRVGVDAADAARLADPRVAGAEDVAALGLGDLGVGRPGAEQAGPQGGERRRGGRGGSWPSQATW